MALIHWIPSGLRCSTSPDFLFLLLSGVFWVTEEEEQGGLKVVVCRSVLMLLDSLFPVLVRYRVCVGVRDVVLAAVHSSACFSLH